MSNVYTYTEGHLKLEEPDLSLSISKKYDLPHLPEDLLKRESIPSSIVVERDNNGHILEAYHEVDGEVHGDLKTFSPDGRVMHSSHYDHGKLVGPSYYFNENGTVLTETWYVDGLKQGKARQFYQNGSLYSLQQYVNGQYHGEQLFYYDDGTLKTTMNYDNGRLHGTVRLYYDNKELKREIKYDQGERIDWEVEYDEKGTKRFEVLHPNQSIVRSWYPDGHMAEERVLLKDIKIEKADITPKIYNVRKWRADGFMFWDEKFDEEKEVLTRIRLSPESQEAAVSRGTWDEKAQAFIWK